MEYIVKVGMRRHPKKVFDEVEAASATFIRQGWKLTGSCLEDGLAKIHLMFERDVYEIESDILKETQEEYS